MTYRRTWATKRVVALLLALIGAAGGPVQVGAADDSGYELHWEVHVSPSGPLKVCLNDTRDIAFSVTSWAEYRNSMRVVRGGLTPTNVTVRQRGVTGWQGVTAEANLRFTFDQLGREQIEIQAASYGWSRREAEYPGIAIIDVEVVKCRYEVEVRSIWHLSSAAAKPGMPAGGRLRAGCLPLVERAKPATGAITTGRRCPRATPMRLPAGRTFPVPTGSNPARRSSNRGVCHPRMARSADNFPADFPTAVRTTSPVRPRSRLR